MCQLGKIYFFGKGDFNLSSNIVFNGVLDIFDQVLVGQSIYTEPAGLEE